MLSRRECCSVSLQKHFKVNRWVGNEKSISNVFHAQFLNVFRNLHCQKNKKFQQWTNAEFSMLFGSKLQFHVRKSLKYPEIWGKKSTFDSFSTISVLFSKNCRIFVFEKVQVTPNFLIRYAVRFSKEFCNQKVFLHFFVSLLSNFVSNKCVDIQQRYQPGIN